MRDQVTIEKRVNDVVERLWYDFDLSWLKVHNKFDPRKEGDRIACETIVDWEYRQASFMWNLHVVAGLDDDDLVAVAIHEIVHALVAPLWSELPDTLQAKLTKLNELAVENVCRVLEHLRGAR